MATFSELVVSVVLDLRHAGFINDANELQDLANLVLDRAQPKDSREDALKKIELRCYVKWLGDFYLPHLSQSDWWGRLEKLDGAAKEYLETIC